MTEKSAIYEAFKRMAEQSEINLLRDSPYTHLLMSEQDRFRIPEQKPIGEYRGIEFVSDPFLKPGEYYLVNRPKIEPWRKIEFEAPPVDLDDPEIRWEYQKTILSAPVKWANKLFVPTCVLREIALYLLV